MTKFANYNATPTLSELNDNDISLLQKEIDLMNKEFPKSPDFVQRMKSLIEDNLRLRILLKNQTVVDEEKKSSVILHQFIEVFDEVSTIKRSLLEQRQRMDRGSDDKDVEINFLKEQIQLLRDELQKEQSEEIAIGAKNQQIMRILTKFKDFIDMRNFEFLTLVKEDVEEIKEEVQEMKEGFEIDGSELLQKIKKLGALKPKIKISLKKVSFCGLTLLGDQEVGQFRSKIE